MAQPQHTLSLEHLEEALTVLFCLIDDAYALLNPRCRCYRSLKRLSDSEVIALALFQQLRGVESERSFLRDAGRFFSHLFPGVVGLYPSSFNRRVKKLRCFLEPLRREILPELVGEPETLIIDSTLLEVLHPRQVGQSAGFEGAAWVRWGSFSVYGLKLHLLCATNRVPISYELTAANVAEVGLTEELLTDTAGLGQEKDLLARSWLPQSSPYLPKIQTDEGHNGIYASSYGGQPVYWIGSTSRDQYSGALFGLAVTYDMVTDGGIKSSISDLVTRLVDFLNGHNWSVVMPDGSSSTSFLTRPDEIQAFLAIGRHVNSGHFSSFSYESQRVLLSVTVPVPIEVDITSDDSYFKSLLSG